MSTYYYYGDTLYHHGIKGQKWGLRKYQNEDGSLTMDGTATANSYFYFHNRNADPISLPQGTYKIVPNTELIGDS